MPWSFTTFEQIALEHIEQHPKQSAEEPLSPEEIISAFIETLAKNAWPDDDQITGISEAITTIMSSEKGLDMTLYDLPCTPIEYKQPTMDDFIAPYNPLFDRASLDIGFLLEKNPQHISVRLVNDRYPRVEVMAPNLPSDKMYAAIYQRTNMTLYHQLKASLTDPLLMSQLIRENFPEMVSLYFEIQSLSMPGQPHV